MLLMFFTFSLVGTNRIIYVRTAVNDNICDHTVQISGSVKLSSGTWDSTKAAQVYLSLIITEHSDVP